MFLKKNKVTARMNKKLNGVNNDIKKQLELQGQRREQIEEQLINRQKRTELCNEIIRSAMS